MRKFPTVWYINVAIALLLTVNLYDRIPSHAYAEIYIYMRDQNRCLSSFSSGFSRQHRQIFVRVV